MRFQKGEIPIHGKTNSQATVLQTIYHYGPITRPDIADFLSLTRPTITTAVKTMVEKGIVTEISDLPEPGQGEAVPGRKAYPVDIVADSRYFLGVEMRRGHRAACLTDYRGHVVYRDCEEACYQVYEENMQAVCRMITRAFENCGIPKSRIAGIGICVPGLVDREKGMLQIYPGYGWKDKYIRTDVLAGIDYEGPVAVSNNSCARAWSMQMFQKVPLTGQSFAYMFISTGIACPLMLNDFNSCGSVVGIGEVGHTVMDPDGPVCRCGNQGCLEAFSSDRAVIEQCRQELQKGNAPILERICGEGPVTMERIIKAQAEGDPAISAIVKKAVYILALSVTNICNFTCPSTMFIDGVLFDNEENQTLLKDVIVRHLYSATHAHTDIIFLKPDIYSGAVGGAAVAVAENLANYQEKKGRANG